MRTQTEITADIEALRNAKMQLLTGKRFTALEIGSSTTKRSYTYGQVTLADLDAGLLQLHQELQALSNPVEFDLSMFRLTSIPLIYSRGK